MYDLHKIFRRGENLETEKKRMCYINTGNGQGLFPDIVSKRKGLAACAAPSSNVTIFFLSVA